MTLLAAYGSVGASSRRQVPVADTGRAQSSPPPFNASRERASGKALALIKT